MQSIRHGYLFRVVNETHEAGPRMRLRNVKSKSVKIFLTPTEAVQLTDSLSGCLDKFERNELQNQRKAGN